jgi:hypothetical protein
VKYSNLVDTGLLVAFYDSGDQSFLDGDSLPKYGEKPQGWKASGRRILRGLYLTGEKFLVNADLNGSANILKKVTGKLKLDLSKLTLSVFDHRNEN